MRFSNIVVTVISLAIEIYVWLILARVFLSFMRPRRYHPVLGFIYKVTEPVLDLCRRILPVTSLGIDFSPFLAIIGLEVARSAVIYFVSELFRYLGV